jgi:threonine dehydratase
VPEARTRADGIAVRVPDPAAFEIIRAGVARIVTVSDDEIAEAIRIYWTDTHNLAEDAARLAALLRERSLMAGKRIGLPLCGGNIDLDLFQRWVSPGGVRQPEAEDSDQHEGRCSRKGGK